MMKNFTLLSLVFFVNTCGYAQANRIRPDFSVDKRQGDHTLTDVPLVAHSRKIQVFFNDEKPQQAYYKVKVIDITGTATTTCNQMLASLQQKAQSEGLDALKILAVQKSPVYLNSGVAVSGSAISNAQTLYAVGLKYPANMSYVDTIIKSASIITFNQGEATPLY